MVADVVKTFGEFRYGKQSRSAFQAVGVREWLDCRSERDACNEKGELDARGSSLESWPTMTAETLDEFRYGKQSRTAFQAVGVREWLDAAA
ncbi:hypothetical protein GCM10023156_25800 [Novipirellula rosea]|uniref:Uncharacterized protein n=1 Tax=Novipirellula rosea TaxID=1031540 RepID=A0ABP8MPQ3_9BACT